VLLGLKSIMKPPKKRSVEKINVPKEIKAIARERVGAVKPARLIVPKNLRKKPKHKKPAAADE
jgi:hypothetical protein